MYCINPQEDEPIFLIDSQIGRDEKNPNDKFVDGAEFVRELLAMDSEEKKRIQVWINSPGGLVTDGMAIYGAILKTKTEVDTVCYGIAYSIAGVIFQAGRKRIMMDYATLMYHEAYNESGEVDKGLNAINEALGKMISSRSWKDEAAVKKMMEQTTYITASDAKDADLCDEVEQSNELNKPTSVEAKARWQAANEYVNKLLPQNKMNKAEICKLLGLDPSISDERAMEALQSHLAKAKADDEETEKMKNELALALKNVADLQKKMKDKEDADASASALAAEEQKKASAKAKILAKITERKLEVKAEDVDNYCALAGTDEKNLEAVIKTIEAIPVIHKAPKFENKAKEGEPAFVVDANGNVKDTEKMVNYMNNKVRNGAKNRFSGKAE